MTSSAVKLAPSRNREVADILRSFRVDFDSLKIEEGEFIDVINVGLSGGTRFSSLERILPDLGMHLKSYAIPRGYPVYSEGVYKIEIQKRQLALKSFDEIYLKHDNFYNSITLGVNVDGSPFAIDLQKLPNLLIGGVPGSGKSALLHSIILSMIAGKSDLYLIDPKMVEFNIYNNIKNACMIANSVDDTYKLINEVHDIMQNRFETMKWNNVRNVQEYNSIVRHQKNLAPITIVIDEWADIFLQDNKIQKPLCVIAQKGRAAGISIVLATQRPSSSIISGLIKANFSGRISLRVASNTDSRIILDQSGGEKISAVGEGLYIDQSLSAPKMFRTTYIKNPLEVLNSRPDTKSSLPFWKRIWM